MSKIKFNGITVEFCDINHSTPWRVIDWDDIETMEDRAEFMSLYHDEIDGEVDAAFLKSCAEHNDYQRTESLLSQKEWANA